MVLKTVAYMCRWSFSENFLEAKLFEWRISVLERKHRISSEKVFSGFSKAHFKCLVQHFEKKMIRVNFTFCRLFRTVCVFFCSDRKISQGFQNHKLSVQRKVLGRKIQTQMLFQNISSFRAEKLGVSSENYQHGCQNCKLRTFRKFWGKTVLFQIELQICSDFEMKKNRALVVNKFSSGFLQHEFALPEKYFEEKWFLFRRSFIFFVIIYRVWVISLSFLQNFSLRCVKPPINVRREKNWGN